MKKENSKNEYTSNKKGMRKGQTQAAESKPDAPQTGKPDSSRNSQPVNSGNSSGNGAGRVWKVIKNVLGAIWAVIVAICDVFVNVALTLVLILTITGVIVGCVFAVYLGNYVDASVEEFDVLSSDQDMTTVLYYLDKDGNPVELTGGKLYGSENRVWASYEDIPKNLSNAFIAIEDKRFEDHNGVDWKRTIRATMYFLIGSSDSGGSTLTQQLIKNVTKNDDNTIQRKVEEIFSALNLEKKMSKEEILEMYMNTVYFSQGCYGVQAAAERYFNKDVSELTLIECAAIAGIVQNPYKIDPILHPNNNKERRDNILYQMLDQGKITQSEFDEAYGKDLVLYVPEDDEEDEPLTPNPTDTLTPGTTPTLTPDKTEDLDDIEEDTANVTSWYMDAVIEDAIKLFQDKYNVTEPVATQMVYSGGYKIYIALDPEVQAIMDEVFQNDELVDEIVNASGSLMKPKSAMVIIEPTTGNVLGIVGDRGKKTESRIFSYATQAKRQPGSAFKPVAVYAPALEKGIINYASIYDDVPLEFNKTTTATGGTRYVAWPTNNPARYGGLTVVNDAITRSVNTVAIEVLRDLGIQNSFDYLTETLGFTTLIDRKVVDNLVITDKTEAALGIGGLSYGVTVMELTASYTIFTNEGTYVSPRTVLQIRDSENNMVVDNRPVTHSALSIQNAELMRIMLENVTKKGGTAPNMDTSKIVATAGKTGTTNKNYDKWFVGFTPYYLGGVWFGYENQQTLSGFSGTPGADLWDAVMLRLHQRLIDKGETLRGFEDTNTLIEIKYCRDSGCIATDSCKSDPRGSRIQTGYFSQTNIPNTFCSYHKSVNYCTEGEGIASEYCPESAVVKVGLINVSTRDFPVQVTVTDAQYVWRDLTIGNIVNSEKNKPFFYNEIDKGSYVGISSGSSQYNRYCSKHYNGQPYGLVINKPPVVEPPITQLPPNISAKLREFGFDI